MGEGGPVRPEPGLTGREPRARHPRARHRGLPGGPDTAASLSVWTLLLVGLAFVLVASASASAQLPSVTIANAPDVREGGAGETRRLEFTVTVTMPDTTGSQFSLIYQTRDGTATSGGQASIGGNDYQEIAIDEGRLTFHGPGEQSKSVDVVVNGDETIEGDETVELLLVEGTFIRSPDDWEVVPVPQQPGIGRILNDDVPTLSIDSPSVEEPESGTRDLVFTVTTDKPFQAPTGFSYTVGGGGGGTAFAGSDYRRPTVTSIDFLPGETEKRITITVLSDGRVERDETVIVRIGTATGTGTILAPPHEITISDRSHGNERHETRGNVVPIVFTVSLDPPALGPVTVRYEATSQGNSPATRGQDYWPASGTLTFEARQTEKRVVVDVIDDDLVEKRQWVTLSLSQAAASPGSRATIVPPENNGHRAVIRSDDRYALSIDSPSVVEGRSGSTDLVFTVRLSEPAEFAVPFEYSTVAGGTATAGTDYARVTNRRIEFAPQETEKEIAVTVNGDTVTEPDETVRVTASLLPEVAEERFVDSGMSSATGTGTILDNDYEISFAQGSNGYESHHVDGARPVRFKVTLDPPAAVPVTVRYRPGGGSGNLATSGVDYVPKSGILTFAPGETEKTVEFEVIDDNVVEAPEWVQLVLSQPAASSGDRLNIAISGQEEIGRGGLVIISEDRFSLSLDSPSVAEGRAGNTDLTFTARLSRPTKFAVPVDYRTVDGEGTATAGADYESITDGRIEFAPGETEKEIVVTVIGDNDTEPDETVVVRASIDSQSLNSVGGSAFISLGGGQATGTGTIRNNDHEISFAEGSDGWEDHPTDGARPVRFKVTLDPPAAVPVTVRYEAGGPDGNVATSGVDYVSASGTLTFAPGETEKTVEVVVIDDDVVEAPEWVQLVLSQATASPEVRVTIATDRLQEPGYGGLIIISEDRFSLSLDSPSVVEGHAGNTDLTFTARLSKATKFAVPVDYRTVGGEGTAAAGADYESITDGRIEFAPGEVEKEIVVTVIGDSDREPDETVVVRGSIDSQSLNSVGGSAFISLGGGQATGTGTIRNDDLHEISFGKSRVGYENHETNGNQPVRFKVLLAPPATFPVTVRYETATSDHISFATSGVDFVPKSGALVFAPGETEKTVEVVVIDDDFVEGEQHVGLLLSQAVADPPEVGIGIGQSTMTAVIVSEDSSALSIDSPSVYEGRSGSRDLTFTVRLSRPTDVFGGTLTLAYGLGGTATAGADYEQPSGAVTFERGETEKEIVVKVTGDRDLEPDETVEIEFNLASGPLSGAIVTGTGTILNDDYEISVVEPDTVIEPPPGRTAILGFEVNLSPAASGGPVMVDYTTLGHTATAGVDYVAQSGTLTFEPGEARKTIDVVVNGDSDVEQEHEQMYLLLSNARGPSGASVEIEGGGRFLGRIRDTLTLAIDSPSVLESAGDLVFTVTIDRELDEEVEITYHFSGGTATFNQDYRRIGTLGSLRFPPGVTRKTLTARIDDDDDIERDETVVVQLDAPPMFHPTGAERFRVRGVGTILNQDHEIRHQRPGPRVQEGGPGTTTTLTFPVFLHPPVSSGEVRVAYQAVDGWGDRGAHSGASSTSVGYDDFEERRGTLRFPAGATRQEVVVTVNGDSFSERTESVNFRFHSVGGPKGVDIRIGRVGAGGQSQVTGWIENDDPFVYLPLDNTQTVLEGGSDERVGAVVQQYTYFRFRSNRQHYTGEASCHARGGTAVGGDDRRGTTNADYALVVGFDGSNDYLSPVSGREVRDGMGIGSCYVNVFGDDRIEEDDTVDVYYRNPSVGIGSSNAIPMGTLTIRNDDHGFSVDAPSVDEGDAGETELEFTVTLDPPLAGTATVDYVVGDGSATAAGERGAAGGHDYTPVAPGTFTFEPGETEKTITVLVGVDETDEPDETVLLTLSNPVLVARSALENYPCPSAGPNFPTPLECTDYSTIHHPADPAAGTILNDDPTPTLSVSAPESAVTEGEALVFPLTLSNPSADDITVHYALAGSATAEADYEGTASGAVTFAPGERGSVKSITLTTLDDEVDEEAETVELTLSLPDPDPGRVTLDTASATGTILDNDLPKVTVEPVAAVITEASAAEFELTRAGVLSGELEVSFVIASDDGVLASKDPPPTGATFAAGNDTVIVTLLIDNDTVDEPDATLTLTLTDGDDHDLGAPSAATITVQDDDATPKVSIADAESVTEGEDLVFQVALSNPRSTQITVPWSLGGTATQDADYTDSGSGSVTFAPLETTKSITFGTTDDTVYEPDDETVVVTLADGDAHDLDESFVGTGAIEDNDAVPAVSIADAAAVVEGGALEFPVTLSHPSAVETTVTYTLGGTATAGDDYTDSGSGSVTFAAGSERETISLATLDDTVDEVDETVEVTLADGDAHDLGAPFEATGTIQDGDLPAVTIVANAQFIPADWPAEFKLIRQSVDSSQTLDVSFTVTDPGEVLSGDAPSMGTIKAGENEYLLQLPTQSTAKGGAVTVILQEGQEYGLAEPSSAFVQVLAGSAEPVSVVIGDSEDVDEGGTLEFAVHLAKPSHRKIEIGYGLSGTAAAGTDYTDVTGSPLVFAPTETRKTISLQAVVDDALDEEDESVTVTLEGPAFPTQGADDSAAITAGYGISVREQTAFIRDKAQSVTVAEETATVTEGDDAVFVLTRAGDLSGTLDVTFEVTGGDAVLTGAAPTTVTFGADAATVRVTLATDDDRTDEPDAVLTLALADSHTYYLSTSRQATVTVRDNDDTPTVSIADDAPTVEEGERLVFPVELTHPSAEQVTVAYTLTGTATAGSDYTDSGTGAVTFAPGEVTKSVALETIDDAVDEPDEETVVVTLSAPTTDAATLGAPSTATGKIEDNEDVPTVSIAAPPAPVSEKVLRLVFPVELSGASSREVTVPYSLGGTATEDEDYTDITDPDDTETGGGAVTFAPGETSKQVVVQTIDDRVDEPDEETVVVTLSAPTTDAATLGASTATGRITDTNPPPVVLIANWTMKVDEGETASFTVWLDRASYRTVAVPYTLGGTADASDYSVSVVDGVTFEPGETEVGGGTLSFAPGARQLRVSLTTLADGVDEPDETVSLTLSAPAAGVATLGDPATGAATIADTDSQPTLSVAQPPAAVTEDGGSMTFSLSLSSASSQPVTVSYGLGGTATEGEDYTDATEPEEAEKGGGRAREPSARGGGTVTFAPGETEKAVVLDLVDDTVDEPDEETVEVTLSGLSGPARIAGDTATGTITDNDLPLVTVAAETGTVTEGADAVFILTRVGVLTGELAVTFSVTGGDAVLSDAPPTTATFGADEDTVRVPLATEDDDTDEADATLTLTLDDGADHDLGTASSATVTVQDDDDTPAVTLVLTPDEISENGGENDGVSTVTATLDRPSSAATTVTCVGDAGVAGGGETTTR